MLPTLSPAAEIGFGVLLATAAIWVIRRSTPWGRRPSQTQRPATVSSPSSPAVRIPGQRGVDGHPMERVELSPEEREAFEDLIRRMPMN
ncbi:hypothetical protein [Streptomyces sp. NPDC006879]|uniref:hypothetical protein n=1 Tax=Streptomyces sp. NPDC006879 TaxID=3364767 RepID=UPI00368C9CC8